MDFQTCCSVHSLTFSQKGNLPVNSWYIMIPADQTSAFSVYACLMTSGAMYAGVPLLDFNGGSSLRCRIDRPKSVALTCRCASSDDSASAPASASAPDRSDRSDGTVTPATSPSVSVDSLSPLMPTALENEFHSPLSFFFFFFFSSIARSPAVAAIWFSTMKFSGLTSLYTIPLAWHCARNRSTLRMIDATCRSL